MDHAGTIRAEIEALEVEVRNDPDPRVVAIGHLKAALAALNGRQSLATTQINGHDVMVNLPLAAARPNEPNMLKGSRPDSKIKRMYEAMGGHIDAHGPTHRKKLAVVLVESGLMNNVAHPLARLGTTLHMLKDYFVSDGQGNYRRNPTAPREFALNWTKKSAPDLIGDASKQEATRASTQGGL